ncbi:MAG: IclR family transcriptional regulator [Tindallia sp. MSAO_Bac2]|nr:MAG: IclR family transcriptional regulator [Tindallia sp. MSAO_Bac2]
MSKTGRVQSIERAVKILNCFSESHTELRLSEIAGMLGLNKSTVHGILHTLKYHGMVSQNTENHKYRLGLRLMELGSRAANSIDIIELARPGIRELCRLTEETVHLGTLDGHEMVYVDKVESIQSMRIASSVGARKPAYSTGMGKAIMAYLSPEELKRAVPKKMKPLTSATIVSMEALVRELEQTKTRGYAIDNEENCIGLKCVAAPIFDHEGKVRYSISVSGPAIRMTNKKMNYIIEQVNRTCRSISGKIGYEECDADGDSY